MKVKIIGAGSIGNHLAQASRRMGWDVVVVDHDPQVLVRMKTDIYPNRYGTWDDKIELFTSSAEPHGGFDLICIGTPPDIRMNLAVKALREKPRILQLEKPLCTPSLQGLGAFLSEYRTQTDTIAVVGYNHAVSESVNQVLRLLDQKKIGVVETIDAEFREHWQGIFSAHPWLQGPKDSYLGFWQRGGGASGEHSHALHLWQLLATHAGLGSWTRVSASMYMKNDGGTDYDAISAFTLLTDRGKMGRVIQDVIAHPVRKIARVQGDRGLIEWICGGDFTGDIVRCAVRGSDTVEQVFSKGRADDFYHEMLHIKDIVDGKIVPEDSPISLESGVAVMEVLATAHQNHNKAVEIKHGCGTQERQPVF